MDILWWALTSVRWLKLTLEWEAQHHLQTLVFWGVCRVRPRPTLGPLWCVGSLVRVRLYKDALPPPAASWEEGLRQLAMFWVVKPFFQMWFEISTRYTLDINLVMFWNTTTDLSRKKPSPQVSCHDRCGLRQELFTSVRKSATNHESMVPPKPFLFSFWDILLLFFTESKQCLGWKHHFWRTIRYKSISDPFLLLVGFVGSTSFKGRVSQNVFFLYKKMQK